MRILIESSTESEWVAQHLEALGHEVIVADPNYAPMYGSRSRKVKTDGATWRRWPRRAARGFIGGRIGRRPRRATSASARCGCGASRAAAESRPSVCCARCCARMGCGSPAGRRSAMLRALDRRDPAAGARGGRSRRCATVLTQLHDDARGGRHGGRRRARRRDPVTQHLMTAPGRGAGRGADVSGGARHAARASAATPARASAFLGLVPSEDSSAERQHKGHITKDGPAELRALLVQASWVDLARPECRRRRAARAGRRRSPRGAADGLPIVALARRLSRILYALWRDRHGFSRVDRGSGRVSRTADDADERREPTAGGVSTIRVLAARESRRRDGATPPTASHTARRLTSPRRQRE